ncbi:MAG: TetR family transcriptional regulator, partial [Rhodococcus sp. (in: high G+C Gram-positive bacteria)]|uniref:TetR family transcriptional regulator n=2 Tax=Rhodococcus TaxID=1827 RepID=UPI003D9ACA0C
MARRRGWGGRPPVDDEEATQRIVAAAVELIAQSGAEISIADVAQSLGVIRQTVYRYFASA